jgi:phage tail-like protein
MAVFRDLPYGNQRFLVDLGDGTTGVQASFSEVLLPDISIDVIEYRNGSDKAYGTRKLPGISKYGDVTLKRGVTGALNLYSWIDQVRKGDANFRRTVTISLLAEDLTPVFTWKLQRAWPAKYSFGELNAQGTDVAIEELVLVYEALEVE